MSEHVWVSFGRDATVSLTGLPGVWNQFCMQQWQKQLCNSRKSCSSTFSNNKRKSKFSFTSRSQVRIWLGLGQTGFKTRFTAYKATMVACLRRKERKGIALVSLVSDFQASVQHLNPDVPTARKKKESRWCISPVLERCAFFTGLCKAP